MKLIDRMKLVKDDEELEVTEAEVQELLGELPHGYRLQSFSGKIIVFGPHFTMYLRMKGRG